MTELLSKPENDAPVQVKQTIEKFETKLLEAGKSIDDAQAQVDALNFRSTATDHVMAKAGLRDAKAEHQPQLDDLSAKWQSHGGARLDAARTAVEALNFKSSATDHVKAKTELRDAEDAWVKSYHEAQSEVPSEGADSEVQPEDVVEMPSIDDIVKVGKNGDTFHKPNGEFIKAEHVQIIQDNQDQIRAGLEGLGSKPEKTSLSIEDIISSNAFFSELRAKANKLIELKTTAGEDSDEYKEALKNWDNEIDAARGRDEFTIEDDAVFEHLNMLIEGDAVGEVASDSDVDAPEDAPEPDDEKLDTSGLDPEKKSIWKKILDKVSKTRASIYTGAGMTVLGLGKLMSGPEPRDGETREDYEKRAKKYGRRVLLGTVAVVGAVIATKFAVDHISTGGGSAGGNVSPEATPGHISTPDSVDSVIPAPETPTPAEFSPEAYNVVPGEGWYNTFKEMGITDATEQANLLRKVGPQLQDMGWAYPMGESSWGISQPGQLPNDVLELIQNSR